MIIVAWWFCCVFQFVRCISSKSWTVPTQRHPLADVKTPLCATFSANAIVSSDPSEHLQFIILGGTGDLSMSKIVPSLFELYTHQYSNHHALVSTAFLVVLVGRSDWSTATLQDKLRHKMIDSDATADRDLVESFVRRCSYIPIASYSSALIASIILQTTTTTIASSASSASSASNSDEDEDEIQHRRNMVYFSLPPAQYLPVLRALRRHHQYHPSTRVKSDRHPSTSRIPPHLDLVIEKPIGYDQLSALRVFHYAYESIRRHRHHRHRFAPRVWCIDHYLGKDLALCLSPLKSTPFLPLRRLFSGLTDDRGLFSRTHVRRIRVSFCDTGTLSGRSGYFDDVGITRDILQNHLMQLLALLLCRPAGTGAYDGCSDTESVHERRAEVLRSLRPLQGEELLLGQYEGYLKEPGVRAQSTTDTMAACAVYSDLPQWAGVPLELWAGKGVDRKESVIRIEYRADGGDGCVDEGEGSWGSSGASSVDGGSNRGVLGEVLTAMQELQAELSLLRGGSSTSSGTGSGSESGSSTGSGSGNDIDSGDIRSCRAVQSLALVLQVQPDPVRYSDIRILGLSLSTSRC